jgi:hemerythrin-like domain-containing protein
MKSTELLTQEHKIILRALDVLDGVAASVENSGAVDEEDVAKLLDFMRWFADAHHQVKEETILFPALRRAAASQGRPIDHLLVEHDQERSAIETLETDFRLSKRKEFASEASRLGSKLRNHIYKEDRILFETADSVLSPNDDTEVSDALHLFETSFDKQILQDKLKDLRRMEQIYLRK